MSRRDAWAWGAAWVVLYALCAGVFWQDLYADSTGAGRIGSFLGRLAGSLLIALLLRWLYVRFVVRRRGGWPPPVRSPAWVAIACVVAAVYFGVAEARAPDSSSRGSCELAARNAADVSRTLRGDGLRAAEASQEIVDDFEARFSDDAEVRRLTAQTVPRRGRDEPVGMVVVVEGYERLDEGEDIVDSLNQASSATVEAARVGGRRGYLVASEDGAAAVALSDPCAAVMVFGSDEPLTRRIAAALDV